MFVATDVSKISLSPDFTTIPKRHCYAVDRMPNGDVLLAGYYGFDVSNTKGEILKEVKSKEGHYTGIQYYKGKIYCLLKNSSKGSLKRSVVVHDIPSYEVVNKWSLPDYEFVSMLAVSNDKVYAVDINAKRVKIFSLTGEPKNDFLHPSFLKPIYMSRCAPDGVLLADLAAEKVHKIDCSTDKIVWSFDLKSPRGVYCDKQGNIWVWSSSKKAYFVRSSDGKYSYYQPETTRIVKHLLMDFSSSQT